ncbi:MAG: bifunctional oligoribonuclease/PAP phosphatase NrnA [Campylobacteraceae bacterium]|nr:bifunctional oligoribonuclease/PAP phosphatase NrnA [Campylobacteraceae bacterium]
MYKKAWINIINAKHILLVSHVDPDGDTLGSVLALYDVLKRSNKKVSLYNFTKELPRNFDFLPNIDKIKDKTPRFFDLVISCDCSSFERLKMQKGDYQLINIDHHLTNQNFGDINIVDSKCVSAGLVVYELLSQNNIKISQQSAICLYTTIVEDTGFFSYSNITQRTFENVSKLVGYGANPAEIASFLKSRQSLAKVRLLGYIFNNFELYFEAKVAFVYISKETLVSTGAKRHDTKNIINFLRDIANIQVAVMILEEKNGGFKVSLRSKGEVDITFLAKQFDGGGHKNAVGFEVKTCDFEEFKNKILKELRNV